MRFKKKIGPEEMARIGAAWQDKCTQAAPSQTPIVVFAIPLIAKKIAPDWDVVCENLSRTMASLRAQTSDQWVAYICGQDRPDGITFDAQVQFVPFRNILLFHNDKGMRGWDKGDKRRKLLSRVMRDLKGRDGYYAQWDADDWAHPEVVAHVTQGNNGCGYLIEEGVMVDIPNQVFGRLGVPGEGEEAKPYWRMCGSSSFVRFDFRTQPRHWKRLMERQSSHVKLVQWNAVHGLPLEPIPFCAGLYTYNNGANASVIKGNGDKRNRYLQANLIDQEDIDTARRAFQLDEIVAGQLPF